LVILGSLSIVNGMADGARRIDLHTHTLLSDGALLPSELLRRASARGYEALAITDHVDATNIAGVVASLLRLRDEQPADFSVAFLVGVEITHVAPASVAGLARQARALGADIVVVHGETPVEPVQPGTNGAAIDCPEVDLLAHPGFLTLEEARRAAARGCVLELTARHGHSLTNGHVARLIQETGAQAVVNTDAHEPGDLISREMAERVALGAGLPPALAHAATVTIPQALVERLLARRGAPRAS